MAQIERLREQFISPANEYTAIPFWFWNDRLTHQEIKRQIHSFAEKGVMGFVIHPRLGIPKDIEYLSDEFFGFVKTAVKEAKELGMTVILYDEAMYPSGCAHGLVVKSNPQFASKGLQMREYTLEANQMNEVSLDSEGAFVAAVAVRKQDDRNIDAKSKIRLLPQAGKVSFTAPDNGYWSIVIFNEVFSKGTIRGIHFGEDDNEENAPKSADLLNPEAVREFIKITHDKYYGELKEYFGNTIKAFFTDEPAIMGRCHIKGLRAWTTGFEDDFIKEGNTLDDLPMLWFDGDGCEKVRKAYDTAINRRMRETFYGQLYNWCENHSISLAGHPEKSWEIGMMKYFHIPGQDVVWRFIGPENEMGVCGEHSVMAKCSSDAARHNGNRRNANECFGCCSRDKLGWALPPEDLKWYMDWLFIRGVNLLYPHAFFYSVDGQERFMERPPDVGPNNIWWPYFEDISLYIKRMSWLMTDSANTAQIAILCGEEYMPWKAAEVLYKNQLEFNYLEDKLLFADNCSINQGKLIIRNNSYSVIVIEDISKFSYRTLERLEYFVKGGGKVLAIGTDSAENRPWITVRYVSELADSVRRNMLSEYEFLPYHPELRVSEVVKDGIKFLALCNEGEYDIVTTVRYKGYEHAEVWEPWGGRMYALNESDCGNGWNTCNITVERRQIILIVSGSGKSSIASGKKSISNVSNIAIAKDGWNINRDSGSSNLSDQLVDWTDIHGMEDFSGTIQYEKKIFVEKSSCSLNVILDLGKVYETAHVYINGNDAGARLWAPYTFDITEYILRGENTICIKVTNSLSNHYEGAKLKSGLIGPVYLRIIE